MKEVPPNCPSSKCISEQENALSSFVGRVAAKMY